jgi:hypothetical protein
VLVSNAYIAASVFSVLGILTRPVLDPLAPLLLLYFAIAIRGLSIKAAAKYLAIYVGIYCVLMAPWWLHNYKAYQTFVRLNLGSGVALLSGNSPSNQSGGIDNNLNATMAPFGRNCRSGAPRQGHATRRLELHKRRPGRFLIQAAKRFQRFWSPWPQTEEYSRPLYKLISFCSFIPVLLLALVFVVLYGRTYFPAHSAVAAVHRLPEQSASGLSCIAALPAAGRTVSDYSGGGRRRSPCRSLVAKKGRHASDSPRHDQHA